MARPSPLLRPGASASSGGNAALPAAVSAGAGEKLNEEKPKEKGPKKPPVPAKILATKIQNLSSKLTELLCWRTKLDSSELLLGL